jgi:protein-S-isoprenylcysteine O-methyltransferase Ste14
MRRKSTRKRQEKKERRATSGSATKPASNPGRVMGAHCIHLVPMFRNQIADLLHRGVHTPCWITFLLFLHPCLLRGICMSENGSPLNAKVENRLTNYSYISGYAGALIILVLGYCGAKANILNQGWDIFSYEITGNYIHSALVVLGACGFAMFVIELIIRGVVEKRIISISNKILQKKYGVFLLECFLNYIIELGILSLAILFYKYANEYGFVRQNNYYQPWFILMDILWEGYLYLGLPYILLTRLLQHDEKADKKEPAYLFFKAVMFILRDSPLRTLFKKTEFMDFDKDDEFFSFTRNDKTNMLGILVKMFFIPVVTVFFADQFFHLVNNWSYITNTLSQNFRSHFMSVADFHNITFSVIFSVDVGLAWCGYVISSRWIKNSNVSTEPTFLGWLVAISCYPPFQSNMSTYFSPPADNAYLSIPNSGLVWLFAVMSAFSYLIYMLATVYFGLRFSNLTHRGIITRGPYSFIRHPAYAAKNFSWWCVMMPVILYQGLVQHQSIVFVQIFGLIFMTYFYYWRAITEERHLRSDPDYLAYCKQVKYRFIPGII